MTAARHLPDDTTRPKRIRMTDPNDSRHANTIAPDAVRDTERDTQPPGEDDASALRAGTLIPPAHVPRLNADGLVDNPGSMPELLYNQLMRVYQSQNQRDFDLLDPDGRFAQLQRDNRRELVREVTEAVTPRFERLESTVDRLRRQLDEVRGEMAKDRVEYERKFAEQQACVDAVNETLAELDKARREPAEPTTA